MDEVAAPVYLPPYFIRGQSSDPLQARLKAFRLLFLLPSTATVAAASY